jgi:hypothetical protein
MAAPGTTSQCRLIVTVLYRTELPAAQTVRSLLDNKRQLSDKDKIVLWDNSPTPQAEQALEQIKAELPCTVEYHHTPENISLAKIYNTVYRSNPDFETLYIFDQDSSFSESYFEQVSIAEKKHPEINLFLPLIRAGQTIISPGNFFYFKGQYWKQARLGVVPARRNTAIASGMAIRMSYLLQSGGFEEQLQLYGIDTNFMLRYAKKNKYFYVFDVDFQHDISEFKKEDRQTKLRRFEDFKKSSLINAKLFPWHVRMFTRAFLWYRSTKF